MGRGRPWALENSSDAASGRQLVYAIFLNSAPFGGLDDFLAADHDVAAITAAIQGAY
jgi:hypothetical protein